MDKIVPGCILEKEWSFNNKLFTFPKALTTRPSIGRRQAEQIAISDLS